MGLLDHLDDPRDPLKLSHWTQRDGSQIPVECMDDEHVDCTIKMLCRNIEKAEQQGCRIGVPMAKAWVERLMFETTERALGRRRWKRVLGYVLSRKIYRDTIAAGGDWSDAAKAIRKVLRQPPYVHDTSNELYR
jgi:hypothetical protein